MHQYYLIQTTPDWSSQITTEVETAVDSFTGYSQVFILLVLGVSLLTLVFRGN